MDEQPKSLRDRPVLLVGAGLAAMALVFGGVLWISKDQGEVSANSPTLEGYDLVMSEDQPSGGRMMLMKSKDGQSTALVFISKGTSIGPGFTKEMQQLGQVGPSAYGDEAQTYEGPGVSSAERDNSAPDPTADEAGQPSDFRDPYLHD